MHKLKKTCLKRWTTGVAGRMPEMHQCPPITVRVQTKQGWKCHSGVPYFFVVEEINRKEREGHFQRKEWEVCFGGSQPMSAGGEAEEPTIRPDHQIFNDTDQQSPQRGVEVDFSRPPQQTELVLDSPLTLVVFAPWHTLTASDGLVPLGLRDWLLHVWDHQVGGGEELVCGHHQPDRAAAHHHLLCWVSRFCICMVLGFFLCGFDFSCLLRWKAAGQKVTLFLFSFTLNVKWKWKVLHWQQHHRF